MYIMDGIVYAGEPTESLEITKVKPLDDMIMLITFSNGETKLFDATILTGPVYEPLKDDKIFKNPVIDMALLHGIMEILTALPNIVTKIVMIIQKFQVSKLIH